MKLYTEEQVRQAIKMADKYHHILDSEESEIISVLESIELPSDEEIYINANVNSENIEHNLGFIKCIQVMRELIEKNKV